jgi:hypothetical protein
MTTQKLTGRITLDMIYLFQQKIADSITNKIDGIFVESKDPELLSIFNSNFSKKFDTLNYSVFLVQTPEQIRNSAGLLKPLGKWMIDRIILSNSNSSINIFKNYSLENANFSLYYKEGKREMSIYL